jgi:hypothetical protein
VPGDGYDHTGQLQEEDEDEEEEDADGHDSNPIDDANDHSGGGNPAEASVLALPIARQWGAVSPSRSDLSAAKMRLSQDEEPDAGGPPFSPSRGWSPTGEK